MGTRPLAEIELEGLRSDYSYIYDAPPGFWVRGVGENAEMIRIEKMEQAHLKNAIKQTERDIHYVSAGCETQEAIKDFRAVAKQKISELKRGLVKPQKC